MLYSISSKRFIPFHYTKATKTITEQRYNDSEISPPIKFPAESVSSCPRDKFAFSSFDGFHGSKLGGSLGCAVAMEGDPDGFKEGWPLATLVGIDEATGEGCIDGFAEGSNVGIVECVSVGDMDGSAEGGLDGMVEGIEEGCWEGSSVGASDGGMDGEEDGSAVGCEDAVTVGAKDGCNDGTSDGHALGSDDGNGVDGDELGIRIPFKESKT